MIRNNLKSRNNNLYKTRRFLNKKRLSSSKSNKVKQIFVEKKFSDDYMKSKEGEYFDNKDYDMIIKDRL